MFSGFMVNAWLVGTIVAIVAGVVGFFVVLRGSAFAAHAIPNGAFAGAAAAYWLGFNTLVGLGVFAVLAAVVIGSLGARRRRDVATALVLVMMLALGALFLSLSGGYEPEVYSLLFGEILGVSTTELLPVVLVSLRCILAVVVLYRPLLLSSAVPDIAEARGVGARRMEIAFLLVVAAATTVTLPVVGALLIFSLMIGPPAAARAPGRPSRARHRSLGLLRPAHRLGRHRVLVPVELAGWVLRGRVQRRVLRGQPGLDRTGAEAEGPPSPARALSRRRAGSSRRPGVGGGRRRRPRVSPVTKDDSGPMR